jgi:hypothetical protein
VAATTAVVVMMMAARGGYLAFQMRGQSGRVATCYLSRDHYL